MVVFWLLAMIMVIIALAFIMPPLLRRRKTIGVAREDLTITVYKDQFAELENDLKNGVISQSQYDQAKRDIERNLLDDVHRAKEDAKAIAEPVVRSKANMIAAVVVALFVPILSISLYAKWGAGEAGLDPQAATPQVNSDQHNETLESMVSQLEEKLKNEPNDGEGWVMLARSYQFMKRYDDAVRAFEKVVALGGGEDPNVLATFADAVAMASGRQLTPRSISLLDKALSIDPANVKALWLRGTAYYNNRDYRNALGLWQRLLAALPADSNEAQTIAANIMEVKSLLGMPTDEPEQSVVSQSKPPSSSNAVGKAVVKGNVTLGGAVASRANPDDTVFVFARAATGPRMPLAIVRKQVKDLPFNFTLDDSMAMNPSMKISNFDQVVVGARISKTGDAMPKPGDLEGLSGVVKVASASQVTLVIDKVVP